MGDDTTVTVRGRVKGNIREKRKTNQLVENKMIALSRAIKVIWFIEQSIFVFSLSLNSREYLKQDV